MCVICEQVPFGGIRDGILIAGSFICSKCEQKIVKTEAGAASYSYFQEKLKKLWRG
ncbi:MAG TPA: inhibitor of sigma-G Gin [Peptococcaceae bacterium]|nr:inhibitor of sigma-G Gin [Peptococcaceae bacterium]